MSGPKIVLLVLIVLALLFLGGVGLGSRGGSDPGSLGWVEGLGSALTPRLDFTKLQGPCLDRQANSFVIPPGSPCKISIPSFTRGTRKMALRLTGGVRVDGQYVAPPGHEKIDPKDESGEQSVTLEGAKEVSLVILKEGGSLSLVCQNQQKAPCHVAAK